MHCSGVVEVMGESILGVFRSLLFAPIPTDGSFVLLRSDYLGGVLAFGFCRDRVGVFGNLQCILLVQLHWF